MSASNIPSHVPAELVRDFDYMAMPEGHDLYEWWRQLHDGPDIIYSPHYGGHWIATRYEDIGHIYETYTEFSSAQEAIPATGLPFPIIPLELDPPLHTDFRQIIAPYLSPKAVGNLGVRARELTIELIDGFHANGECEFMTEFALKMPVGIFMSLVDLPMSDAPRLHEVTDKLARGRTTAEQVAAFQQAFEYLAVALEARKANPGPDLLSALHSAKVDGGRNLTEQEKLITATILLGAGLDTVVSMLGFIAKFLACHPGHRQQLLDDPALIPQAVEELLRRHNIANLARVVAKDFTYKGVFFKKGDAVLIPTTLAGIDERQFPDAMTVDFQRRPTKQLVFGRGPHQCVGAFLARTELRVFVEEWLKRIPDFEIVPGKSANEITGRVNTLESLPLRWQVA